MGEQIFAALPRAYKGTVLVLLPVLCSAGVAFSLNSVGPLTSSIIYPCVPDRLGALPISDHSSIDLLGIGTGHQLLVWLVRGARKKSEINLVRFECHTTNCAIQFFRDLSC